MARIFNTIYNSSEEIEAELNHELEEPSMYTVIMHNDHYTTMPFVVEVLKKVFHKSAEEANNLMMQIHTEGSTVCGIYIYDIANTKVSHVHALAKHAGFPLRCSMEEV
ncbi:MAG: ATP-dependent Clp protease adaptor ClpS [Spirochaetes bacterium]|nr:ATP-dependent Clp protease adaptor ClpS [Spirochaetota bacterium]MBN2769422.1 ATP-dependent Clp protease adaptor ClpS [Spirochaetota bacterium]HRX16842.1 ATP-dependent Clp protease adaptor ClpS [Spirochaetota bacterium]